MPKGGVVPPPSAGMSAADDEDYMNQEPEGVFHTYSNQKELLEQVTCTYTLHVPPEAANISVSCLGLGYCVVLLCVWSLLVCISCVYVCTWGILVGR